MRGIASSSKATHCSALRLVVAPNQSTTAESMTPSVPLSIRMANRPFTKYWKRGAWRLSVLPAGLTSFGRRDPTGKRSSDFALAQFEDLRAAALESRVSPVFVNGLFSDRSLASALLPHNIVSLYCRREPQQLAHVSSAQCCHKN
jgi:hypothetical protein